MARDKPDGAHAGDMPNLHVPQSGDLTVEVVNAAVTLDKGKPNSLFDADGSAIVAWVMVMAWGMA